VLTVFHGQSLTNIKPPDAIFVAHPDLLESAGAKEIRLHFDLKRGFACQLFERSGSRAHAITSGAKLLDDGREVPHPPAFELDTLHIVVGQVSFCGLEITGQALGGETKGQGLRRVIE
jgi:hypothetical protein